MASVDTIMSSVVGAVGSSSSGVGSSSCCHGSGSIDHSSLKVAAAAAVLFAGGFLAYQRLRRGSSNSRPPANVDDSLLNDDADFDIERTVDEPSHVRPAPLLRKGSIVIPDNLHAPSPRVLTGTKMEG